MKLRLFSISFFLAASAAPSAGAGVEPSWCGQPVAVLCRDAGPTKCLGRAIEACDQKNVQRLTRELSAARKSNDSPQRALPPMIGQTPEQTAFLKAVYGLIMPYMRSPPDLKGRGGLRGAIAIYLKEDGSIARRAIHRSSGEASLDAAAIKAVDEAAKFPPPPPGARRALLFSYGTKLQ